MKTNMLIPMAGDGKRFRDVGYDTIKPLIDVCGKPMIQRVIENLEHPDLNFIFIIRKDHNEIYGIGEVLMSLFSEGHTIVVQDGLMDGPVASCLLAKEEIDSSVPLVIANADQIVEDWDFKEFERHCHGSVSDGVVGVFDSLSSKNSYIKLNHRGWGVKLAEKKVISTHATNGIHWWKHGSFFVESAEAMIAAGDRVNGEFYVAPSYNKMIELGAKITAYEFEKHFPIGIPEDLQTYKERLNNV